MIRCPSSSFVYPRKRLWLTCTSPFWYRYCSPNLMFWLSDWLSCWARDAIMVSSTSPLESIVLIFSFSKKTGMFFSFSSRIFQTNFIFAHIGPPILTFPDIYYIKNQPRVERVVFSYTIKP